MLTLKISPINRSVFVDLQKSASPPERAKAKADIIIALVHKNGTINQNGVGILDVLLINVIGM